MANEYFDESVFLWSLASRPEDAREMISIFRPQWLHEPAYQAILAGMYRFIREYKTVPDLDTLGKALKAEDETMYTNRLESALDLVKQTCPAVAEQVFVIEQAKRVAITRSFQELINQADFQTKILSNDGRSVMREIARWQRQFEDSSVQVTARIDELAEMLVRESHKNERAFKMKTGVNPIDEWTHDGLRSKQLGIVIAPTGHGKCHRKGTEVILASGRTIKVEDVRAGMQLMGPDSLPREVVGTHTGFGPMYKIVPTKGRPWYCNDNHILSLVNTSSGNVIDISVKDYLEKSKWFKHLHKLYRVAVEFPEEAPVPYDPYVIGLLLGDGTKQKLTITSMDNEILEAFGEWGARRGFTIRDEHKPGNKTITRFLVKSKGHTSNELAFAKTMVDDTGARRIPEEYLFSTEKNRLALLAGLIDTDGYLFDNCYEISMKDRLFAEQVEFLARSLGFGVSVAERLSNFNTTNYRLNIYGDVNRIPVRLERRKALPRRQVKNVLRTGFNVEYVGEEEHYGFELDGDHRYLLKDFTVTHNSVILMTMAYNMAIQDELDIWFVTNELSAEEQGERFLSRITGEPVAEIQDDPHIAHHRLTSDWAPEANKRLLLTAVNKELTTNELESMMTRHKNLYGWKPDVVCLDYMERMKPNESGYSRDSTWNWLGAVAGDLVRFAKRHNVIVWTAAQTNRLGMNPEGDMTAAMAQGSIKHLQEAAAVIGARKVYVEGEEGSGHESVGMEFFPLKMRHGVTTKSKVLKVNLATMRITKEETQRIDRTRGDEEEDEEEDLGSGKNLPLSIKKHGKPKRT